MLATVVITRSHPGVMGTAHAMVACRPKPKNASCEMRKWISRLTRAFRCAGGTWSGQSHQRMRAATEEPDRRPRSEAFAGMRSRAPQREQVAPPVGSPAVTAAHLGQRSLMILDIGAALSRLECWPGSAASRAMSDPHAARARNGACAARRARAGAAESQ